MDFDNIFEGFKENKKTLIITLVLLVVLIIISILNFIFNNREEKLNMEEVVKSFAELYYEQSYYPEIKSVYKSSYIRILEKHAREGIKLTLNDIVNLFEDVDTKQFYEEGNYCNFLETYALIYPKSPYEVDDYEIKVNLYCEKEV